MQESHGAGEQGGWQLDPVPSVLAAAPAGFRGKSESCQMQKVNPFKKFWIILVLSVLIDCCSWRNGCPSKSQRTGEGREQGSGLKKRTLLLQLLHGYAWQHHLQESFLSSVPVTTGLQGCLNRAQSSRFPLIAPRTF